MFRVCDSLPPCRLYIRFSFCTYQLTLYSSVIYRVYVVYPCTTSTDSAPKPPPLRTTKASPHSDQLHNSMILPPSPEIVFSSWLRKVARDEGTGQTKLMSLNSYKEHFAHLEEVSRIALTSQSAPPRLAFSLKRSNIGVPQFPHTSNFRDILVSSCSILYRRFETLLEIVP